MTEISLLLLKLLTPQNINITPVIRHKLVVMNLILNQTIPCTDHHKQKNSRFAIFIAYLLSAKGDLMTVAKRRLFLREFWNNL